MTESDPVLSLPRFTDFTVLTAMQAASTALRSEHPESGLEGLYDPATGWPQPDAPDRGLSERLTLQLLASVFEKHPEQTEAFTQIRRDLKEVRQDLAAVMALFEDLFPMAQTVEDEAHARRVLYDRTPEQVSEVFEYTVTNAVKDQTLVTVAALRDNAAHLAEEEGWDDTPAPTDAPYRRIDLTVRSEFTVPRDWSTGPGANLTAPDGTRYSVWLTPEQVDGTQIRTLTWNDFKTLDGSDPEYDDGDARPLDSADETDTRLKRCAVTVGATVYPSPDWTTTPDGALTSPDGVLYHFRPVMEEIRNGGEHDSDYRDLDWETFVALGGSLPQQGTCRALDLGVIGEDKDTAEQLRPRDSLNPVAGGGPVPRGLLFPAIRLEDRDTGFVLGSDDFSDGRGLYYQLPDEIGETPEQQEAYGAGFYLFDAASVLRDCRDTRLAAFAQALHDWTETGSAEAVDRMLRSWDLALARTLLLIPA